MIKEILIYIIYLVKTCQVNDWEKYEQEQSIYVLWVDRVVPRSRLASFSGVTYGELSLCCHIEGSMSVDRQDTHTAWNIVDI